MYRNISSVIQVVNDTQCDPVHILPRQIVSHKVLSLVSKLSSFKKVELSYDVDSILLKRSYALGDIILLFPIVSYFKKLGKRTAILAGHRYCIDGVDFVKDCVNESEYELFVDLNGVIECDHNERKLYNKHRLDIYKEILGLEFKNIDWFIPINKTNVKYSGVLAVQSSGSQSKFKSIDLRPVIKSLKNNNIFLMREYTDKNHDEIYRNVIREKTTVRELLEYMVHMRGVVCFDSGPLWLSHVVNIPAFVITGPTYGGKLVRYHPNKKSRWYDTKIDVNCPKKYGCGELANWCKKSYTCMNNVNYTRLLKEINNWLEDL
jgi:hypothetical protein